MLILVESLINKNYIAIILFMSNNSSNCLIKSSCCLLSIPTMTTKFLKEMLFVVKIVSFKYSLWIIKHWIGYTNQTYSSCCIITKIKTLRDFTSAHSKNYSSLLIVNILIVSRDNIFILRIFSGLLIYTFKLFYLINNASTFPKFIIEIDH